MQAVVEADEQNCGKDADHPLALRVKLGKIYERGGYREGMEFHIWYRLKIEGGHARTVSGVCSLDEMRSAHTIDDADADDYIAESIAASVIAVKTYLEAQFPGETITGTIRSLFESAYHRQKDFAL